MEEGGAGSLRRSYGARIGLSLLNLLTPGVGLVRTGPWRAGLGYAAGYLTMLLALAAAAVLLPTMTPDAFLVVVVVMVALALFFWFAPTVATWRSSLFKLPVLPWWRRWYALAALILAFHVASGLGVELLRNLYRTFYMPAESMHPTLIVGERLVADMRGSRSPKRGEIILFNVGDAIYVKRVAALSGDKVTMQDGVPVVNGISALQRKVGTTQLPDYVHDQPVDVLVETLPGENGEHRVLDAGYSQLDDTAEVRVPPGHLFVLGDNRDFSADSRVAREMHGAEMVPLADVVGRPLFKTWTAGWRWLGTPIR